MTNNKLIFVIVLLTGVLFGLLHIQKQNDNKIYVIATVDVYHHIAQDPVETPKIETVSQPLVQQAHAEQAPAPKPAPKKPQPVVAKKETVAPPPKDPQKIIKKWWDKNHEIQDLVNYAYKIGGKDFLLTLEGENGLWKWDRKSSIVWANGYSDYGMCQLNWQFHADFIFANGANLKAGWGKDFQNPYKQLDYCLWVWKDAQAKGRLTTTFYAYNVRHNKIARFENLP